VAILRVRSQSQRHSEPQRELEQQSEPEQLGDPAVALRRKGPVVEVTLSTPQSALPGLARLGRPVRPALTGLALISTQAELSVIDYQAAKILDLPVIDIAEAAADAGKEMTGRDTTGRDTAGRDTHGIEVYAVHFSIASISFARDLERVLGSSLGGSLVMVIGRDVLQECAFLYNGKHGEFTFFS